jgi:NAD+ synthase (glutamine-hydrolysing)
LGDVYKTDIYKLASYINSDRTIIPLNIINKPPSAELRPGQLDTDSLPPYRFSTPFFISILNCCVPPPVIETDADPTLVARILRMVNNNEYKRLPGTSVLRISSKAFGDGRKMPLVARY